MTSALALLVLPKTTTAPRRAGGRPGCSRRRRRGSAADAAGGGRPAPCPGRSDGPRCDANRSIGRPVVRTGRGPAEAACPWRDGALGLRRSVRGRGGSGGAAASETATPSRGRAVRDADRRVKVGRVPLAVRRDPPARALGHVAHGLILDLLSVRAWTRTTYVSAGLHYRPTDDPALKHGSMPEPPSDAGGTVGPAISPRRLGPPWPTDPQPAPLPPWRRRTGSSRGCSSHYGPPRLGGRTPAASPLRRPRQCHLLPAAGGQGGGRHPRTVRRRRGRRGDAGQRAGDTRRRRCGAPGSVRPRRPPCGTWPRRWPTDRWSLERIGRLSDEDVVSPPGAGARHRAVDGGDVPPGHAGPSRCVAGRGLRGAGRLRLGLGVARDPGAGRFCSIWGSAFRPYRSVVAWYCWQVVDNPAPVPAAPLAAGHLDGAVGDDVLLHLGGARSDRRVALPHVVVAPVALVDGVGSPP